MTQCYAVKEEPCIKCMSSFDLTEPDDGYFADKREQWQKADDAAAF